MARGEASHLFENENIEKAQVPAGGYGRRSSNGYDPMRTLDR